MDVHACARSVGSGTRARYSKTDAVISFFSSLLDTFLASSIEIRWPQEITSARSFRFASVSDRYCSMFDALALGCTQAR